jgi:hypothetical protein
MLLNIDNRGVQGEHPLRTPQACVELGAASGVRSCTRPILFSNSRRATEGEAEDDRSSFQKLSAVCFIERQLLTIDRNEIQQGSPAHRQHSQQFHNK